MLYFNKVSPLLLNYSIFHFMKKGPQLLYYSSLHFNKKVNFLKMKNWRIEQLLNSWKISARLRRADCSLTFNPNPSPNPNPNPNPKPICYFNGSLQIPICWFNGSLRNPFGQSFVGFHTLYSPLTGSQWATDTRTSLVLFFSLQ